MKLLLDTHTFLWFIDDNPRLSSNAKSLLESDNDLLLSTASLWEIAIKLSLGKLILPEPFEPFVRQQLSVKAAVLSGGTDSEQKLGVMKKKIEGEADDELRPEYDLKKLRVRKVGPGRRRREILKNVLKSINEDIAQIARRLLDATPLRITADAKAWQVSDQACLSSDLRASSRARSSADCF